MARRLAAGRSAATDPGTGHEAVQRATALQVLRSPGRPLDSRLREEMESRLGADFSDVRVHCGPLAHELTHEIQQRQGPVPGTDTGHGLRAAAPHGPVPSH
ncbi:eCIS core domain-containing protein [Streptomyces sp. 3211]|uniref:eCIS core domain-containing protein n=1 Tax=Streptomyces sp. 3211 TaxID=1964449 RepID=UPI0017B5C23B